MDSTVLPRAVSLLKPTGGLTLGNYLGALRPMKTQQLDHECFYGVADLHALTIPHNPGELRDRTAELAIMLLAMGLDQSTLFIQSHVRAHRQMSYILEATTHTGELARMIQYKEKGKEQESTRVSLYTYPILMAADILLYRPQSVPVGDDQRQHLELTRAIAKRFNSSYGQVFTVPELVSAPIGARVMDLVDPRTKMGKSGADGSGIVRLLDSPDEIRRKIMRATTDSESGAEALRRDQESKPGVTNLLDVLEACGGSADGLASYGALKTAVADAVIAELEPLQKRYHELAHNLSYVTNMYSDGASRCEAVTLPVLTAAEAAIGLR